MKVKTTLEAMSETILNLNAEMKIRFNSVDNRLDKLEGRMDSFEREVMNRFEKIDQRFEKIDQQFEQTFEFLREITKKLP